MMFRQDKRFAAGCESVAIALFDGLGCFTACEAEVFSGDRQVGAGSEPHEIQSVRGWPCFVEVVDAPNQAAFLVAPSPEVLDVQVADSEHSGSFCQVAADFGPVLQPSVEGSAEKGECGFRHVLMFQD